MFKIKGSYPYPILLSEPIDYKRSVLEVVYRYQSLKNSHSLLINCKVKNREIEKLIKDKKACFAIQIESPNAFFRKMYESYDEETTIELSSNEVIDFLDIGVAILAKENINNYKNHDFVSEFKSIEMSVEKNEIIGVYPSVRQIIASKDEILKEINSIFNIKKSDEANVISYDPHPQRILVTVPTSIGNYYLNNKEDKDIRDILNAIILIPVLTCVLGDMLNEEENSNDEESLSSNAWYKTLNNKLEEIMKEQNTTREQLLNDQHTTAQLIMKNITIDAVKKLKAKFEIIEDGDDE